MAFTLAEEVDSNTAGATGAVTLSAGSGDLIIIPWVIRSGAPFVSVIGTLNGAYTSVGTPALNGARAGIHFFQNSAAGTEVVTVTASGSDTILVKGTRWTGGHASAAFLAYDTTTNTAVTSHPCGATGLSVTVGQLIVCSAGQASTVTGETAATGFTELPATTGGANRQYWQYRIATGTESNVVAAFTASSSNSGCVMASFDLAAAAGSNVNLLFGKLGGLFAGKL